MRSGDATPDPNARRVARECLALRVHLLNRVVTRIYDDALRPLGITANQLSILTVLENMTQAQPGAIGRYLEMEKSTVSRNVKRMRQQGWVREKPGPDARSVVLTVTEKGRALFTRAVPHWVEAQARVRELLGDAGVTAITGLVDRHVMPARKS
jgi:DNA-binding MarR family transcriptional regulator